MMMRRSFNNRQKGAVLATTLILLAVLTLVAVPTMQDSNLEFKMSMNAVSHETAFNNAESGRLATIEALPEAYYEMDWSTVKKASGLTPVVSNGDIRSANKASENLYDISTLDKDVDYADGDIDADIYIMKGQAVQTPGSGSAMSGGYKGLGKDGGQGAIFTLYEIRTVGFGPQNARAVLAVDYKVTE